MAARSPTVWEGVDAETSVFRGEVYIDLYI